ncbi:MAG: DinB family protein [Chloroflexi bacterium]|nr:DinB family protein [Chloroflexota bacterium]
MDTITFIRQSLNQVHQRMVRSLDGLSEGEATWRPAPHANTIIEILWHAVRSEDRMGTAATGRKTQVWESQEWFKRFGHPEDGGPGEEYQFLKEEAARAPALPDLVAYKTAVHEANMAGLQALSMDALDDPMPDRRRPGRNRAAIFRLMITHNNNHHGQMDFMRGLQQSGWNLPPGTGVVQQ